MKTIFVVRLIMGAVILTGMAICFFSGTVIGAIACGAIGIVGLLAYNRIAGDQNGDPLKNITDLNDQFHRARRMDEDGK